MHTYMYTYADTTYSPRIPREPFFLSLSLSLLCARVDVPDNKIFK